MVDRNPEPNESVCPYCGVGCGIEYDPDAGGATGWKGPVNARGEICPKGAAAWEIVEHDDRLIRPQVRRDGDLVSVSWAAAFDRIESDFGRILSEAGPDAVGFFASSNCTNEENYVLQKLARAIGTNNVDNCARLCHSSTVAAMDERFGAGAMTNTLEDLREADVYLVAGANPAEQHPIAFRSYLLPSIRDGTELIHVDPRRTDTTDAAEIHLPVRPGFDIPLCNAIAKVILEEDLVDRSFLEERVDGVEPFREAISGVDVDANARCAGVDPDDLRAAARMYGGADRAAIFTGMGMSQHHCGTDNVHSLLNLALLTGNVGKPGTGVNPLRGQNNVQGAGDVGALPDVLPGYRSVTDAEARRSVADVWGFEPPATPGLTEVEMTHAFGESIRGAVVFGENPAVTEPNVDRVRDRLDRLECLVVIDLFHTETVEYADIVLPGSAWAEKAGTVTNTDRQVMRMRPNAEPPGEARPDLSILCELGDRLTDELLRFDYDDPEAVFEELRKVLPQYAGMSYPGIGRDSQRWPFPENATTGRDVLHAETFSTGSETAPLRVVDHTDPVDPAEGDELVLTTGRLFQHFNSGALTRRSGTLVRMRDADVLQIHPEDADRRSISDGDVVTVTSDHGSVSVEADVTPAIRTGTVFMSFHFADPLVNRLTGDTLDPVAKIPEYKHSSVRVEVTTTDA